MRTTCERRLYYRLCKERRSGVTGIQSDLRRPTHIDVDGPRPVVNDADLVVAPVSRKAGDPDLVRTKVRCRALWP